MRVSAILPVAALAFCPLSAFPAKASSKVRLTAGGQRGSPMGWNSWNFFAERVTDKDIRNATDQLVAAGMKDAGYIYVNIDDIGGRARRQRCAALKHEKFPDMKALADYVHSKGLKLGIYSSPGPKTCAGYEASLDHEAQDAALYASWGVDYLNYDPVASSPP